MTTTAALVVDIVDLPRQIGSVKDVRVETAAPADLGTDIIGVPEGSPIVLDAQLTSMEDGVLARGRAGVHIHGRCVRCLRDLDEDLAPVISASVRSVSTQEGRRAWIDAARTLPKGHRLRAAVREGLS